MKILIMQKELKNLQKIKYFNVPTATCTDETRILVLWENIQINSYKTPQQSNEKEWLIFASYWGHYMIYQI